MLSDGSYVARIFKTAASPVGTPWMWTILVIEDRENYMLTHGYAASREAAITRVEATDLRIEDVSFDRATLWVRRLKGSNSGMHPIEGDELRAIRRYLATRNDNLPWLFLSERQGRLSRFAINYLVDRTAKAAGFDNLHPHCLRHSCGYALADRGIDLRTIQDGSAIGRLK